MKKPNRSRRLRKKLHVDEFKENYISINFKIRKDSAEMMDVEAWCDFHDELYDLVVEAGGTPGSSYSCGNKMEISFTQFACEPDVTKDVVALIEKNVDVYLKSIYATPPVDVYHWSGWDHEDPFEFLSLYAFLANA